MKKLLLSLCVGLTVSSYLNASVINVDGWDSYEPPIRVANDTEIDDDATGKSTANGVVITKPNASNINKNIDVVDCDNPRFSEICQQLNVTITNEVNEASKDAKSYAKYLSDRDREEMNRLIADTRDFADKRADQAQNNAEDHADWIRGDLKTYADFVALQAQNNANEHSNGLNDSLQDYVDIHDKESKDYAKLLADKAKEYAAYVASQAQSNSNSYADDLFAQLDSGGEVKQGLRYIVATACQTGDMAWCNSLPNHNVYRTQVCTQLNLSVRGANGWAYTCKRTLESGGDFIFLDNGDRM